MVATRKTLTDFYNGDALHAGPMYRRGEFETLRQATVLVAAEHDGLDIVVCAPIPEHDVHGDAARAACLSFVIPKIHEEFETGVFVFDKRTTPTQNELDLRTIRDLRAERKIGRDAVGHHCQPSREPLLGLPDVLAWSYRQEHTRRETSWFEPMRDSAQVKFL